VRRSLRASTCSSRSPTSGCASIHGRSTPCGMRASLTSVTAVAVAVRGPGSNTDSSPNWSEGPITASTFSRPSGDRRESLILPDMTM
jgi:hypothetical protein